MAVDDKKLKGAVKLVTTRTEGITTHDYVILKDVVKKVGVPDSNSVVYSREVLEAALKRWAESGLRKEPNNDN